MNKFVDHLIDTQTSSRPCLRSFTRNVEGSDNGESTNLARTIACAVASAAMADRASLVIKSLCYHVSAAECWMYE